MLKLDADNLFGPYRKFVTAVFGVVVLAVGLFVDGGWSAYDSLLTLQGFGFALGVYGVPNDAPGTPLIERLR